MEKTENVYQNGMGKTGAYYAETDENKQMDTNAGLEEYKKM